MNNEMTKAFGQIYFVTNKHQFVATTIKLHRNFFNKTGVFWLDHIRLEIEQYINTIRIC